MIRDSNFRVQCEIGDGLERLVEIRLRFYSYVQRDKSTHHLQIE